MNTDNPFKRIEIQPADAKNITTEFKICIEGLQKTLGDYEIVNLCRSCVGNAVNEFKIQRVPNDDSVFVYFQTLT